jgi:tetratricopeptide (TPR) repeat protein
MNNGFLNSSKVVLTFTAFLLVACLQLPAVFAATGITVASVLPVRATQQLAAIHWQLGGQALTDGDIPGAITELEQAIALNPTNRVWQEALVKLYEAEGLYYPAIQILNNLTALVPTEAKFWYERGLLFDKLNQLELAAQSLQKAVALDNTQGAYYYDLGVFESRLGHHQASAAASLKAIELKFNVADAYNNYGYALSHTGNYVQAEQAINQALARQPEALAATLDSKGFICHKQQRYKEALYWYNKALQKDPLLSEVQLHKAQTLEATGQLAEAVTAYQTYIRLTKPNDELASIVEHLKKLKAQLSTTGTQATNQ